MYTLLGNCEAWMGPQLESTSSHKIYYKPEEHQSISINSNKIMDLIYIWFIFI